MNNKYKDESEIEVLIRSFEGATINRDAWRHAEHLTVALYYLSLHDIEIATEKMRSGIFKLLAAFGVDRTKEMPYHETLTVFWMRTVYAFSLKHMELSFLEKANSLVESFDKDYPLNFYSRDVLFSDAARAKFVDPDLAVLSVLRPVEA